MVEKKNIVIVAAVLAFLAAAGANFIPQNDYICPDNLAIFHCEGGLSGGIGSRCYLETKGQSPWKVCSSGWQDITQFLEEEGSVEQLDLNYSVQMQLQADNKLWRCGTEDTFDYTSKCVSGMERAPLGNLV